MLEETDVEDVDEVLNVEANGEKEKGKVAQEKNESKVKTNDKRVYCCDECGVLSKNLANLKKHMLTHSGERPFKCSTCPKAFRQQHHLVDHQRTHTGERPFRCDQCGASYVQKSSLNLHKKKHTGIKPYVCKICGYSAYEKIHLKIHMRTHTGEKPYQCEKCGQTFSTSTRLNFHRMIHTGEKRYKCEECGVHFREKVTLEQHRGVHVNLGPFVCSECGQEFSKLAGLSLHRKVHTHKDDYLYVYNKEANEAFKSATFSKSKESSEVQNQSSLREETTDKLTNDNEHTPSSTNETENVSEIQYNIPRSSEEMTDCSLPDKSKVVTMVVSSSISKNTSPQKTQLVNASDLKLQNVKETLVSSLKNHAVDCFSSDVNPDQVRAALESGKIVKTEDGEGKGFFIVLPPALRNEEIMFMSESAQCKSSLLADSHPDSNPVLDHDISSKFCTHNLSIIKEKTQVADSEEELQGSDLCIEVHEEVSEEPSSFSVGINEELRDINALKMKRDIVGNVGRYSQVKKEIHPDGSSLFLWNDELEPLEEVTYIIDEGTENPLTIHSQEVLDTPNLKPKKRKAKSDDKRKQKKALLEPGKSRKTKEKNKIPKEKKVKIPRIYDCIQCGKACRTSSNYISHMRTHSGERPYFCDICGMGFKQIAHLRSHIRTHTGERPYVCDICHAAFTQSSRLNSHKKSRHTNTELKKVKKNVSEQKVRNFYCKICKKTFINECYKREHMRSHIQPKDFKCKICDVRYKTKISLVRHTLTHSDHQVVCEMCGLGFPNLTALHNHRFNEHNKSVTDSGVSDMCISVKIGEEQDFVVINPSIKDSSNEEGDEKAMRKVVTFEEVSDGHAKHKVLQLTEEDGQIRSRVLLETPASEVQIKLEEKTDTDVSGAPSGDQNNKVDVDYNGMDDIKQDKDESGKEVDENHTFHWSDLLEKEKINREKKNMWSTYINNEGKKIWQCEVCNRLFLQSSNLHCHMRMHTGEKPYKCNVCSRAFRQITHLKDHMSRHTGIRPHQCSACGSLFSQRSAATRHIKLAHQGVKDAVVIRNTQPQVNGKNKSRSEKTTFRKCSKADVNDTCTCKICIHSYPASCIKAHIRCPTGERLYTCIKCRASFKQKGQLKTHMFSHSKWKLPFVCSCGNKYKSHKILCDHKRSCRGAQETTDQVLKDCGGEEDSCSGCPISKHKQNCNITDNDSDQSTDVSDDISFDDESDEEIIIPRKKNTNLYKNIKKHEKMEASKENRNNEKKKYICPKCKEVVVEFTTYKNHILGHGNHLKEVCEICGEVFRRASTLKFHQNVKHGRKDERYKEFNTFAEDRGKNEDDEHYTDFELKLSDNERDEGDIKESILNDSDKDKDDNLKLRSLTRSKNKIKGNSEKANTKMLPVCTMDTLHSDKTNSSVKKLSCKSKMKSKRVSTFKEFIAKKKECQDNLEKGTSNRKAHDTATEGKYTCEACNMVFTRHSKLRYHMAMWCKKQEKSAEAVNENISGNSQSPNGSSLQVIVREVSLKKGKNSDSVLLEGSLSCSKNIYVDNQVKSCNESGDASKKGGTEGTKFHESGEELPQIETLLVKEEKQPSDSVKLKTKGNAFYCNICRKHFCKVNSYKVHMATHLNERPFKCDRCLQTFNQKAHLTSHYRRHTGERPYKCPHCFQAFTQPHNLKKHRKKCNKETNS